MSERAEVSTGYEGDEEGGELDPVKWTVERAPTVYSVSFLARVMRGEEAVGVIRCRDVKEFNWIQRVLTGTYDPTKEE